LQRRCAVDGGLVNIGTTFNYLATAAGSYYEFEILITTISM
jgi:hypothetical protein